MPAPAGVADEVGALGRVAAMAGHLALVGGGEFTEGCSFDAGLLEASGADEVLVIPTGAAYEHPDRLVERAVGWFDRLGVPARGLDVLARPDAQAGAMAAAVATSRFTYLVGGSPMHLRSVMKDSLVWAALVAAWNDGATVAGSSAGAMVLCDPMVDPRGGALTLGLGLLTQLAVIPHHDTWSEDKAKRTLHIAPKGIPIAGIDERTALIRDPEGRWRTAGAGQVAVFVDGAPAADLSSLP
jgi:cyanophycinase